MADAATDAVNKPVYVVSRVLHTRDRLFSKVYGEYLRVTMTLPHVLAVSAAAAKLLKGVEQNVVFASTGELLGQELTPELARLTAWRLAGNVDLLRQGEPATVWVGQRQHEWVPVDLLAGYEDRDHRHNSVLACTFSVLAGSAAGRTFSQLVPAKVCRMLAWRVGFSRRGTHPYKSPLELVGLRMLVRLEPGEPGMLRFFNVDGSAALVKYNRTRVLDIRCRVRPCPKGYQYPCRSCVVGQDACVAAVRPVTLLQRGCSSCGLGWYAPTDTVEVCVECRERLAKGRTE